jgi:uncharacterized protein YjiK
VSAEVGRSSRRWSRATKAALLLLAASCGCRTASDATLAPLPSWDPGRAEIVEWQADDPDFAQDRALEASGLDAADSFLYLVSEKYATLLVIEPAAGPAARSVRLAVPRRAEIEGIAATPRTLLICDEAHAAVYEMRVAVVERTLASGDRRSVPVRALKLRGLAVRGGKLGFEGIELDPVSGDVLLLLERSQAGPGSCVSTLFRLRRRDDELLLRGSPLAIELADCAWRLTGLEWYRGQLLALRTQFPGERYEVITIDLATGAATVVLELTELLRSLAVAGWGNNVEGIAVAEDGALWLVADNAMTGTIDDPRPPPAAERSLLLRIPADVP